MAFCTYRHPLDHRQTHCLPSEPSPRFKSCPRRHSQTRILHDYSLATDLCAPLRQTFDAAKVPAAARFSSELSHLSYIKRVSTKPHQSELCSQYRKDVLEKRLAAEHDQVPQGEALQLQSAPAPNQRSSSLHVSSSQASAAIKGRGRPCLKSARHIGNPRGHDKEQRLAGSA